MRQGQAFYEQDRVIRLYSPCRYLFRIYCTSIRYSLIRLAVFLH